MSEELRTEQKRATGNIDEDMAALLRVKDDMIADLKAQVLEKDIILSRVELELADAGFLFNGHVLLAAS